MARQDLTRYQQGIVRRHYEHFDTKLALRLQEILSDLYLAERAAAAAPDDAGARKALDRLWARARENLIKAKVSQATIDRAVGARKSELLAEIIQKATQPGASAGG